MIGQYTVCRQNAWASLIRLAQMSSFNDLISSTNLFNSGFAYGI